MSAAVQLKAVDVSTEQGWSEIIGILMSAGVTSEELQEELAASPDLVRRWYEGSKAPRHVTRRLLKDSLVAYALERGL